MYYIDSQTLEDLAKLLDKEDRLFLFEYLCKALERWGFKTRARKAEIIALKTDIQKTHVYRYLNCKLVPNHKTAAKIIKVLLDLGEFEIVLKILEPIIIRMYKDCKNFRKWKRELKRRGFIYDPLSPYAFKELKTTLY